MSFSKPQRSVASPVPCVPRPQNPAQACRRRGIYESACTKQSEPCSPGSCLSSLDHVSLLYKCHVSRLFCESCLSTICVSCLFLIYESGPLLIFQSCLSRICESCPALVYRCHVRYTDKTILRLGGNSMFIDNNEQ